MTHRLFGFSSDVARVAALLHLDAHADRQLVSISTLLREASAIVREEARAKSLEVRIVGVDDEVFVDRARVVLVVGAMLLDAIRAVPPRGRVAVTAQEIERELVFAVFDSGAPRPPTHGFDDAAAEVAPVIGGRLWTPQTHDGNLTLFAVPLRNAN